MCYEKCFRWKGIANSGCNLLGWRRRLGNNGRCWAGRRPVVKPPPDIFNNPIDALYDIVSGHSTARHDRPLVGLDSVQVESLKRRQSTTFIAKKLAEFNLPSESRRWSSPRRYPVCSQTRARTPPQASVSGNQIARRLKNGFGFTSS